MLYNISELSAVYFGNIEIQEVYQGSTLIWKSAGLVTPINIYPSNNSISIPKNIEFESSEYNSGFGYTNTKLEYKVMLDSDESVIYNDEITP